MNNLIKFQEPVEPPRRYSPFRSAQTAVELQLRDSVLANRIAEAIARVHINDHALPMGFTPTYFEDLPGLQDRTERTFYEALGAYALRFCRKAWRVYAHKRAVDRAYAVVQDCMTQVFTEPSVVDPSVRVPMPEPKIRALLSILVNEACLTYRSTLDGTLAISPKDVLELHEQEGRR